MKEVGNQDNDRSKTLEIWMWIDIGTYFVTLAYAIHNTIRFVILGGRWTNVFLSMFYVCTVLACMAMIFYLFTYSRGCLSGNVSSSDGWYQSSQYLKELVFFSKATLSLF